MRTSLIARAKNFFELASTLPKYGIGQKVQRTSWKEHCYWTITGMKPSVDGKHGKAFGILTWRGKQENQAPKRVNGTLKKVWKRMDQPSVEWVNLEKPRFNLEAAASETNATNV